MSADTVEVAFTSPDYDPITMHAIEVLLPGGGGVFSVKPGHTALLSTLIPGVVQIVDAQEQDAFVAVTGGFVEVRDNTVTVLAEAYEPGSEIDLKRAQAAHERATKRLEKPDEELDLRRAEAALARALARIQAHGGESY